MNRANEGKSKRLCNLDRFTGEIFKSLVKSLNECIHSLNNDRPRKELIVVITRCAPPTCPSAMQPSIFSAGPRLKNLRLSLRTMGTGLDVVIVFN